MNSKQNDDSLSAVTCKIKYWTASERQCIVPGIFLNSISSILSIEVMLLFFQIQLSLHFHTMKKPLKSLIVLEKSQVNSTMPKRILLKVEEKRGYCLIKEQIGWRIMSEN